MVSEIEKSAISRLPTRGVYTLVIFIPSETSLIVGKLGTQRFLGGYYAYTGSAMGRGASGLRHRLLRHLRKGKRRFWHADFLLAHENATVATIIAAQTDRRAECQVNRSIKRELRPGILVKGFGSSDCKRGCEAHLLYFGMGNPESKIAMMYERKFGCKPQVINFSASLNIQNSQMSSCSLH